jgi:hypothetical protein
MRAIAGLFEFLIILIVLAAQILAATSISFVLGAGACWIYRMVWYQPLPPGARDCATGGMAPFLVILFPFILFGVIAGFVWWCKTTLHEYFHSIAK